MSISEKLTQQRLQEILLHAYSKGQTTENINIKDLIEEIKQQLLVENTNKG